MFWIDVNLAVHWNFIVCDFHIYPVKVSCFKICCDYKQDFTINYCFLTMNYLCFPGSTYCLKLLGKEKKSDSCLTKHIYFLSINKHINYLSINTGQCIMLKFKHNFILPYQMIMKLRRIIKKMSISDSFLD